MAIMRSRFSVSMLGASLLLLQLLLGSTCITSEHEKKQRTVDMSDMPWGPTVDGWRLSVSLDKTQFFQGTRIVATIVFQNLATQPRSIGGHGVDFDYELDCRNQQETRIPFTLFGKRMLENRGEGKATGGVLEPGDRIVAEIILSRHLDLTLPGRYAITVSRKAIAGAPDHETVVTSNTFSFEIVD